MSEEGNVESQLLGFMGKGGAAEIDFGAKTAIIVRDDSARVRLRESMGDGLIFTIFEVRVASSLSNLD